MPIIAEKPIIFLIRLQPLVQLYIQVSVWWMNYEPVHTDAQKQLETTGGKWHPLRGRTGQNRLLYLHLGFWKMCKLLPLKATL